MTNRLYYDDPYNQTFDATVRRVEPRSSHHAVWLDRSAFYPTSGGQPFDLGTLNGQRVVEVLDEDDDIVHVVESTRPIEAGAGVHGQIDWARRFDHMQQHTGQHILSSALIHCFDVPTVSFHLGAEVSTIDVPRELTAAQLAAAEDEANRVVWQDRPVTIRYASAEAAAALPLRKESARTGTLRLIEIADYDVSACGGTHVARTGAVGIVAIRSWERFRGGHRLEFVCGGRAQSWLRALRDQSAASVKLLSVLPADLPSAIDRLQTELRAERKTVGALHSELAAFQAEKMVRSAEPRPWGRLVAGTIVADAGGLRALASAMTSTPGILAILVSESTPALIVAARASGVPVACDEIVKRVASRFGGRGGGKPDLAQAGGLQASAQDVLVEAVRDLP